MPKIYKVFKVKRQRIKSHDKGHIFFSFKFLSMDYENMSSLLKALDKTNRSRDESD